ncbi:MAG: DUF6443 domain-containing protein [Cyclobacteriaceae bacterium]
MFIISSLLCLTSIGQSFTGPEEVCPNKNASYSYYDDVEYTDVVWSVAGGGIIVSGSGLSRVIKFPSDGSVTVTLYNYGLLVSTGTKYVTTLTPGTLSSTTQTCAGGAVSLFLSGHTGSSFYWEYSTDGTTWNAIGTFGASITQYPTVTTYYRCYPGSCGLALSNVATVNVYQYPVTYSMTGGGGYCSGGSGTTVGINGSQSGVSYQLKLNGANYGAAIGGTGGALNWNNLTTAGSYTVVATSGICSSAMSGSASVYINSLPSQYNVFGGGSHCSGGSSAVFLSYSQSSVNYQLYLNGSPYGGVQAGNFSQLAWTGLTSAGNYTVIGTNPTTGCVNGMIGSASITVYPLPNSYTVAGGGAYCTGSSGVTVSLNGSQSGVNYYLKINGQYAEGVTAGTGGPLYWTNQTTLGNYTVEAVGPGLCYQQMSTSVNVSTNPIPGLPSGMGGSVCGSGSVFLSANFGSNGNNVRWYSAPTGGTLLTTGLSYTTPSISASTNYYISSYNDITLCESQRVAVSATVHAIPGTPTPVNGSTCGTGTVSLSASFGANANTVRWYATPSGGAPFATGLSYVTPTISSSTTYYISSYHSSTLCESARVAIVATVKAIPTAPSISGHERFGSGTFNLLASGGSSYEWYSPSNALLSTSALYTTPVISTTTANYAYAKKIENGCYSTPTWANLVVYPDVMVVGTGNAIALAKDVVLDAGAGYQSYDWRNGGPSLGSGRYYSTNAPGSYTVTVTQGSATGTSTPFVLTEQFENLNYNYVVSNNLQTPVTNAGDIKNLPVALNSQSVQYLDGLGRPWQSVVTQGSLSKNDIVQHVTYDQYGRQAKKYTPYVSDSFTGILILNPTGSGGNYSGSIHYNFYNNGGTDKIADDARPFTETFFEASPLNRPVEEFGAGTDWHANSRSTKFEYLINQHGTGSGQEQVIVWDVNGSGLPVRRTSLNAGYYPNGELSISSIRDEAGNETREYKNKEGQVVLKKVQYVASPVLSNKDHWTQTYYIYDERGLLRYVLQPELSKTLHASGTTNPTTTQLNNFAFQYKYDYRNRMSEKKVPSGAWIYMVYDSRDRLVLTQDGVQRATSTKYWTFTKYDELNRPIVTGIKDTTVGLTQSQMQGVVDSHYQKAWARFSETFVGNALGNMHGYSNLAYPIRTRAAVADPNYYLTVTYYDNYDFQSTYYNSTAYNFVDSDFTGEQVTQPFTRLKGQVTGTKTKVMDGGVIGGSTYLKAISYYDDRYRLVQSIVDNYKGGQDRTTNVYDFVGKVLKTKTTYTDRDVTWKDQVGTVLVGNRLIRSSTATAGAASTQMLGAGVDGYLEFFLIAPSSTHQYYIGFNDNNLDVGNANINYAFRVNNATLQVWENGVQKLSQTNVLKTGDVLKIDRTGSTIRYYRNSNLVYTSVTPFTGALLIDTSFPTNNANMVGLVASFAETSRSITRRFTYDHAGRLIDVHHSLNDAPEILLTRNEYNELGQLVDKKLHSTDGTNFRQSVDYRYNIRGWLTSMNNAQLQVAVNNDDSNDLWGMNIAYNEVDAALGNTSLYNGNISAIKWSKNLGLGNEKQQAYRYSYDPLNRLQNADYFRHNGSWSNPDSRFAENGLTYDQNGNIKTLLRRGDAGSLMDNLVYTYNANNQLLKVADSGDKVTGFIDGTNTGNDYTYDANGNMVRDQNKGITSNITYNFLNLPELVVRGTGNSVRYIYDATGRKLAQVATYSLSQKQTDYLGELVYENDELQFISHEEGRIVLSATEPIYGNQANTLDDFTPTNATAGITTLNGNQNYVQVTSSGTTPRAGVFPIGNYIAVQPGERYKVRVKGYRTGTNPVYIQVKINGADNGWPGATLPNTAASESWVEQHVTVPAGASVMDVGVVWNTVAAGEVFYINDIEVIQLLNNEAEYQYHLKDHLGNTRLTFTTRESVTTDVATLETAHAAEEQGEFLYYEEAVKVNYDLFDHTNEGGTWYSTRLTGQGTNSIYGLAKSLQVMPGDQVSMEVYAKYLDPEQSNWTGALASFMAAVAGGTAPPGTVIDGGVPGSIGSETYPFTPIDHSSEGGTAPKAYLNYILFNKKMTDVLDFGYRRVTSNSREYGQDAPHDRLYFDPITITEPGYMYIYLSNENDTPVEVYFDDLAVTHTQSPVVQSDEYYPFGLTFNSYSRENSAENKYLYQSKEIQDGLDLDTYDFGARMYDPSDGRWWSPDPLAEKFYSMSPYVAMANNPIRYIDPNGMEFTEAAWAWVNRLVADINSRQERNNEKIGEKREALAAGGLSEKQTNRLNRQIGRLESNNQALEETRGEIGTMAASSQVYNVVESSSLNENGPISGMGNTVAATSFNFGTGAVDITISSNAGLGLFAHELKHGYQFETGQISLGSQGRLGAPFLLDKHDEVAGYQRQALFGSSEPGANGVNSLPDRYKSLPTGPVDVNNYSYQGRPLSQMNQYELTRLSGLTRQAFRFNGTTYYQPNR